MRTALKTFSRDPSHALALCSASAEVALALCFEMPAVSTEGKVPDWIEIIPAPRDSKGKVVGEDGRVWFMKSAEKVAKNFRRPIPIDFNHATEYAVTTGGRADAAGWVEELQAREGALWGRTSWTPDGEAAVKDRAYRFLSPAFTFGKAGDVMRVTSVGLVNTPNFPIALNQAQNRHEDDSMDEEILTALGLPADADMAKALTAIDTLKAERQKAMNTAQHPDPTKWVPKVMMEETELRATNAETELTNLRTAGHSEAVDREVNAAIVAGKITKAGAEYYKATCSNQAGLDAFKTFAAAAPVIVPKEQRQLDNPPPQSTGAGGLSTEQKAICARLGLDEGEYAKNLQASTAAAA